MNQSMYENIDYVLSKSIEQRMRKYQIFNKNMDRVNDRVCRLYKEGLLNKNFRESMGQNVKIQFIFQVEIKLVWFRFGFLIFQFQICKIIFYCLMYKGSFILL